MKILTYEEFISLVIEMRDLAKKVVKLDPKSAGFRIASRKLAKNWQLLDFNMQGHKIDKLVNAN